MNGCKSVLHQHMPNGSDIFLVTVGKKEKEQAEPQASHSVVAAPNHDRRVIFY